MRAPAPVFDFAAHDTVRRVRQLYSRDVTREEGIRKRRHGVVRDPLGTLRFRWWSRRRRRRLSIPPPPPGFIEINSRARRENDRRGGALPP